jgi:hypothetical protein
MCICMNYLRSHMISTLRQCLEMYSHACMYHFVTTLHGMAQLKPRHCLVQERIESDGQRSFYPLKPVSWDDYPASVLEEIENEVTNLRVLRSSMSKTTSTSLSWSSLLRLPFWYGLFLSFSVQYSPPHFVPRCPHPLSLSFSLSLPPPPPLSLTQYGNSSRSHNEFLSPKITPKKTEARYTAYNMRVC